MSTHPRLESRVSVLERRQNTLEALIEELSEDMTGGFNQIDARVGELSRDMAASFKQLAEYQIHTEGQIDTRFNQVKADLKAEILAAKDEIKNDMTAMETRILDSFKQLLTVINAQRPPSE